MRSISASQKDPPVFKPSDQFEPDLERAAGEVIDGEAIIINLVTGAYYSMQGIGGRIWTMIGARRSITSMHEEICRRYEVSPTDAQHDLQEILGQLLDEKLIARVAGDLGAGSSPSDSVEPNAAKAKYERPTLQTYRDMEDLLALDPPAPGMSQIAWSDRDSSERK